MEKNTYTIIDGDLNKIFWGIVDIGKKIQKETDQDKINKLCLKSVEYRQKLQEISDKINTKSNTILETKEEDLDIDKYLHIWHKDDFINKMGRCLIMLDYIKQRR